MHRIQDMLTRRSKRLPSTMSATLAMALVAGAALPASTASAQTQREDIENPGDWEWESDEGYHREEWYDPSDWFDGEQTVDYEYEWGDAYGDDSAYDDGWVTDSDWYDGYWDGYYDGYYDDDYGYDNTVDIGSSYGDAYTSGYYDGYYDSDTGYDYDPYYYVYTWDYDNARISDRQRSGDQTRERGDRSMPGQRSGDMDKDRQNQRGDNQRGNQNQWDREDDKSKQGKDALKRRHAMAHEKREKNIERIRGEVASIEFLRGTGSESGTDLIARVKFKEDGKAQVVNMGPKMSRSDVPFSKGDTVTFKGVREQMRDREVLTTHKLHVEGETVTLANAPQWRQDGEQRQQQSNAQLQGIIRDIARVNVDSERYTVLRVRLRDGSSELVAFSSDNIEDKSSFKARPGDEIRIRGQERQLDGRSVIRPDRVTINGQQLSMR